MIGFVAPLVLAELFAGGDVEVSYPKVGWAGTSRVTVESRAVPGQCRGAGNFASTRPAGSNEHIYASTLGDDGTFGAAVLVPELSSTSNETRTAIRRDGLEFFVTSTRPNGRIGKNDIWVSTRDSHLDPWSTPVNLGPTVNFPGEVTGAPALSWDATTLYCYSTRPDGFGVRDLYVATREKLRKHERRDESDHQRS